MDRHTTAASDNHILVAEEAFQAVAYTEATCLVTTSSSAAADQDNLALLDPVIASSSLLPFAVVRVVSSLPYS